MNTYIHPATRTKLDNILKSPAHGYIFSGPRYMFKDDVAIEMAHQLTGGEQVFESPNIIKVEPEDGKNIKIAAVKEIREGLSLTAYDGNHPRVVVIRQADKMTTEAANALLKTFEEPHDNIVFILTANRLSLIPATVRSRLQVVGFVRPNADQLQDFLVDSGVGESTSVQTAVAASNNLPRLAQLLLSREGVGGQEVEASDVAQFLSGNLVERFALIQKITKQSLQISFLSALERIMASNLTSVPNAFIAEQAIRARRYIDANVSPRLVLEHFCLELEL